MSEFNKDDYLNDLPDPSDAEAAAQASSGADASAESGSAQDSAAQAPSNEGADAAPAAAEGEKTGEGQSDSADTLTPLGKAKKEAVDYLEALQRERAEFINYRNRTQKEQERFRQHGIIDVLTALLPALDDIDRIREHSEMDDSFKAVATKIDKAFEKFGVEKFGEKGEDAGRSPCSQARNSPPSMTRSCTSRTRMPKRKRLTPWSRPATASAIA